MIRLLWLLPILLLSCESGGITASYESEWEFADRAIWEKSLDTLYQPEDWEVLEGRLSCITLREGLSSLHLTSDRLPSQHKKPNRLTMKVKLVALAPDSGEAKPNCGFVLGGIRDGDPHEEDYINDWEQGIIAGLDGKGKPAFWYAKGDFMRAEEPMERGMDECNWTGGDEVALEIQVYAKEDQSLVLKSRNLRTGCTRLSALHNISHRHLTGKGNLGLIASKGCQFRDWQVYVDWVAPD